MDLITLILTMVITIITITITVVVTMAVAITDLTMLDMAAILLTIAHQVGVMEIAIQL